MRGSYSEPCLRVFGAAFSAAVEAALQLSDRELESLARYSGIVGMAAEQVKAARSDARDRVGRSPRLSRLAA
jgi:hypothetical protein